MSLLLWLLLPATAATLYGVPRQGRAVRRVLEGRAADVPAGLTATWPRVTQTLVLLVATAMMGTYFAPRVGLYAPFFEALANWSKIWGALSVQLIPSIAFGAGGGLALIGLYYGVFWRFLSARAVSATEELLCEMGIGARVLMGGVVEEIQFRWGVMSGVAWLGVQLFGSATDTVMWSAIMVAGVVFGLWHLPGSVAVARPLEIDRTLVFWVASIGLNLWAGIVFGWLFWQYGLLSAMIAHALFHVGWLPFNKRFARSA